MKRENYIFALGFFDGVHLGHQALLRRCVELASMHSAVPAAMTFDGHPQSAFADAAPLLLTGQADREKLLRQYGMEYIHTLPVTKEVMSTDWEAFLAALLQLGAVGFVCGHDFRFGRGGEGNGEKLAAFCEKRGLPCAIVPQQTLDGVRISSTRIRSLLETGDMETACRCLGHPHVLTGTVVAGRQLGRTIGIPTANLVIPGGIAEPLHGVYACKAKTPEGEFLAVTNVGSRPTVEGRHVTVEPWLLDYSGDLYGKEITLEFYAFLRPERRCSALEALKQEIQKNAAQTREIISKN